MKFEAMHEALGCLAGGIFNDPVGSSVALAPSSWLSLSSTFSLSLSVEAAEETAAVARQRMPGQLNAEVKVQLTTRHGFHSDVQIYPSRNRILDLHGERNR